MKILGEFYLSLTWLISKLSRGEVKLCGAAFFGSSNLTSNLVDILWYFFFFSQICEKLIQLVEYKPFYHLVT